MDFASRLSSVLLDRKKTPWGNALGFTGTSVSSIFSGHVPGPEFLTAICKAENTNLNWLLTGDGCPFEIAHFLDANVYAEKVEQALNQDWCFYIISLDLITALVLTRENEFIFKDKNIPYKEIKILVGLGSEKLAKSLRENLQNGKVSIAKLRDEEIKEIILGNHGTYSLFHYELALLKETNIPTSKDLQFFPNHSENAKPINLALMRDVVNKIEDIEKKESLVLSSDQKSRVIAAVYRQAERLKFIPSELSNDIVIMAFDVIRD